MAHEQHLQMLCRRNPAEHAILDAPQVLQTVRIHRDSCRGAVQRRGRRKHGLAALTVHIGGSKKSMHTTPLLQVELSGSSAQDESAGSGPLLKWRKGLRARQRRLVHELAAGQEASVASAQKAAWRLPQDARRLLAGAFAGVMSKTATAPIESVRMQLMAGKGGVVQIVKETWSRGGPLGFFAGNFADVLRVMPSRGVEFAAFDLYKRLLGGLDSRGKQKQPNAALTGLAGGAAGVTSTIACYPLETLRTRLAVDTSYNGIVDCFRKTVAADGVGALYQGLGASLIGVVPYAALRLGVYDGLKRSYIKATGKETMPSEAAVACGLAAGLLASTATFPLEVVRRRMMSGQQYPGTFAAVRIIAQQEGWQALYRGLLVSSVKQAPQNAVTFWAYELAKSFLRVP